MVLVAIQAIEDCEERGDFSPMRILLQTLASDIIAGVDDHELRRLCCLLIRVIKAIDHEHIHGAGSLLDWDHPFNLWLLSEGLFSARYPERSALGARLVETRTMLQQPRKVSWAIEIKIETVIVPEENHTAQVDGHCAPVREIRGDTL
ncbi:hypothetical protein [Rhizobium sp. Rhizsp82]|uniref:hypothetical protein n=1 Tax=Rhizobium sp. Rhizsp82 TaxID=3243057 RepID=UPI0039B52857